MNAAGLTLLLPDKPDVERDALADVWERLEGSVMRLGRFWDPPALDPRSVRVYGSDAFCLVLQQKLGLELCSPSDELIFAVPPRHLCRAVWRRTLGNTVDLNYPAFCKPTVPKLFPAGLRGRSGARWNSPRTRVAYASSNSALAVLEVLVHMTSGGILPAYSLVTATLPDTLVEDLAASDLPENWASSPVPPELQAIGDAWIRSSRSLALRVPSAVVQGSYNILINPEHTDFAQFTVESSEPFGFDPRLLP